MGSVPREMQSRENAISKLMILKIFDFFYFLARNGSQMVKNHLVNIELTIWTHFWPNLSIFQIFSFFSFSITFIGNLAACLKV